jgi:hypothetical protein
METLEQYSILLVYSAMAIYALAFISFALDLAKRSSQMKAAAAVAAPAPAELVGASVSGRGGAVDAPAAPAGAGDASGVDASRKRSVTLRIGVALTILGFLLQLCELENLASINRGPLGMGVLTGAYDGGATPEQIAHHCPSLPLSTIHRVIGFVLEHRPEVDRYLRRRAHA